MATFSAIKNKSQNRSAMKNALDYISRKDKTLWQGHQLVTGHNCMAQCAMDEMMTTKQRFKKTGDRMFYHFVQSFSPEEDVSPEEVHAIGLELAEKLFPDFEVLVATHVDTHHLHSHLIVNSVSYVDGRKLHQNAADLQRQRQVSDELCAAHGLTVLEPPVKRTRRRAMRPGEYRAALKGDSWKLDLIQAINEALEYAMDRESFIANMEQEGYQVVWTDTRKHITFTCPNGRKSRDSSLHDETFLKENLEALFLYRQATGFRPGSVEPEMGWMGDLAAGLIRLGRELERAGHEPVLPAVSGWTDSKQRQREALKKLALGQKLSQQEEQAWGQRMI